MIRNLGRGCAIITCCLLSLPDSDKVEGQDKPDMASNHLLQRMNFKVRVAWRELNLHFKQIYWTSSPLLWVCERIERGPTPMPVG